MANRKATSMVNIFGKDIVQEVIHFLTPKEHPSYLLKLEFRKAYYKVRQVYLRNVLKGRASDVKRIRFDTKLM